MVEKVKKKKREKIFFRKFEHDALSSIFQGDESADDVTELEKNVQVAKICASRRSPRQV